MNTQTRREIRFGLVALAVSGLLFTASVVLRGPINTDPVAFMPAVLSPNFVPGVSLGLIGGLFQIYGLFGMYRYLTYQRESLVAFLAVVLSSLGIVLVLPLVTFLGVNVPVIARLYQQGDQKVIAVFDATFSSTLGLAVLGASTVCGLVGAILFAIAIWRDEGLSKWASILFGLSGVLLALSGPGFFVTELLGAVFFSISAILIIWKGWQESKPEAG